MGSRGVPAPRGHAGSPGQAPLCAHGWRWVVVAAWCVALLLWAPAPRVRAPQPRAAMDGSHPASRARTPSSTAAPAGYCPVVHDDDGQSTFVPSLRVERDFWLRVLSSRVACQVVTLTYHRWPARQPSRICVYDAHTDSHASRHVRDVGRWTSQLDVDMLSAAGPCTPARPFVMVVGAGVGIAALAAAASGCHVILFEPWSGNFGRTMKTLADAGVWSRNVTMLQNAVAGRRQPVLVQPNPIHPSNPALHFPTHNDTLALDYDTDIAWSVWLDDLFMWPHRPAHPHTATPLHPAHVNVVWLDVDAYNVVAAHTMTASLRSGAIPYIRAVLHAGTTASATACDGIAFLSHMQSMGYRLYVQGEDTPWARVHAWWRQAETGGQAAAAAVGDAMEVWFVHAAVPPPQPWPE